MGIVLQFPNRRAHRLFKCPGTDALCQEGRCFFCEGGLTFCEVCNRGEAELEDFCPGPHQQKEPSNG